MSEKPHLWQAEWIDDEELGRRLEAIPAWVGAALGRRFDIRALIRAADTLAKRLRTCEGVSSDLAERLVKEQGLTRAEAQDTLLEMAAFLEESNLERKLQCEFGSRDPFLPTRQSYTDSIFEAWAPLGLLVHVAPSNSPSVAPLSVVEGLLAGNVNFLKTSGSDGLFPQYFLKALIDADPTGLLGNRIVAARIPSRQSEWLARVFSGADGIAVWGGEEAARAVRTQAPPSTRVIEWGHKISLIYVPEAKIGDEALLRAAARESCLFEQQACSSPQCIYVETEDWAKLEDFGARLARVLAEVSPTVPRQAPSRAEQAEITLVTELARQESCFGQARVFTDPDWRILVDARSALQASPLFRTIWVKPLPRGRIVETLRPMRQYLQTVGLMARLPDFVELSELFVRSGVVRVRRLGEMTGSYVGEAHDGVYALTRYAKRVCLQGGDLAPGISSFADLRPENGAYGTASKLGIMNKAEFQALSERLGYGPETAHLYFKSGGSSGEPKLSIFSYDDYHEQMRIGAEGLYAAGLEPPSDRNMNLFFSGALYGGFLSIFSVLECLGAVQFPMGAVPDFPTVAEAIIRNRVNVLLGMPSYLVQLFEQAGEALGRYRGVKKIFYGGEHFNDAQRRFLHERFGVELIRSVGYGSVDTGPLGYQCRESSGSIHHLHQRLQFLEIVKLERDEPVSGEEVGRLIFTSRMRKGQPLERYELGDVGNWVGGQCPCGRAAPRFRLLGRSGDVFRIGSVFLNYQKFTQILAESLGYAGSVQLTLEPEDLREKVVVRLASNCGLDGSKVRAELLRGYDDLREVVEDEKLLGLEIALVNEFERVKGSGKLARILDRRRE